MDKYWVITWTSIICLTSGVLPQYRDKNISTADTDAVHALLTKYLQRRLQGAQLSTPPPPAVLFSMNHQAKIRQAAQRIHQTSGARTFADGERKDRKLDYEDYEDDLQGYEDSERGRTRIDLLAGK